MQTNTITLARFPIREYGKTGRLGIDQNQNKIIDSSMKENVVRTAEPILGISEKQVSDYFWDNRVQKMSKSEVGEINLATVTFDGAKGVHDVEEYSRTLTDVAEELNPFPNHSQITEESPVEWAIERKDNQTYFLVTTDRVTP